MSSLDKAIRLDESTTDMLGKDGIYTFFEVDEEDRVLLIYSINGRFTIPFDDLSEMALRLDAIARSL